MSDPQWLALARCAARVSAACTAQAWPQRDDVAALLDPFPACQFQHQCFVQRWLASSTAGGTLVGVCAMAGSGIRGSVIPVLRSLKRPSGTATPYRHAGQCARRGHAADPDIGRRPARDEQLGQGSQHVFVFELAGHDQGEAFAAGLIDDRQDAELAAIMGPALDEVVCPDVPRILRAQPDARAIVQP